MKDNIQKIRKLISEAETEEAISLLINLLKEDKKLDELILQSARENRIKKQIRNGTISFEDADTSKNKVNIALLEICREIEQKYTEKEKVNWFSPKRRLFALLFSVSLVLSYFLLKNFNTSFSIDEVILANCKEGTKVWINEEIRDTIDKEGRFELLILDKKSINLEENIEIYYGYGCSFTINPKNHKSKKLGIKKCCEIKPK